MSPVLSRAFYTTILLSLPLSLMACGDKAGDDTGSPTGATDAGTTDGGTDAGTTDGGTADGGTADGGTADGGTTDGGTTDGGTTDGGTTDGGTTDGGTTDGGTPVDPDITVNIDLEDWATDADLDGLALVLYPMDLGSDVLPTDDYGGGAITGTVSEIALGDPATEDLGEVTAYPGTLFGFYLPTLVVDTDGDDHHSDGEIFVAMADQYALYLGGTLHPDLEADGYSLGWMIYDFDTGLPSGTVLDMTLNMQDRGTDGAGGAVELDFASDARLALVSVVSALGDPDPMVDQLLTDPWAVDLSADPPASHQYSSSDTYGASIAAEAVVALEDTDSDGVASTADRALGLACVGRDQVVMYWAGVPVTFSSAYYTHILALHAGWQGAVVDVRTSAWTAMAAADLTSIAIGTDCVSF